MKRSDFRNRYRERQGRFYRWYELEVCEGIVLGRLTIKTATWTVKCTMRMKHEIIGFIKNKLISYSQNKVSLVFH